MAQSLFVFSLFACLVSSVLFTGIGFATVCCCLLSVGVVYISLLMLLCCGALLLVWIDARSD